MPTAADVYRNSIHHLERAVAIDPDFSLAWVGLHFLYDNSWGFFQGGLPNAAAKAEEAEEKSLRLTPDSPFVLSNLSTSHARHGRWEEADRFHAQAIAAAKRHAVEDHFCFRAGLFYHMIGDLDNAIYWYERARIVDPLNAFSAAYLSDAYLSIGEPQKAMGEVDRFERFNGPDFILVKASGLMAAMASGDRAALEKRLDDVIESESVSVLSEPMRDRLDDREAALAELYRVLDDPQMQSPFIRNIVAIWAAYWGETELSLRLLSEFMLSRYNRFLVFLVWRRVYQDVRRLPGFRKLLTDVGLVDYWRRSGKWGKLCRPLGDADFECW